MKRSRDYCETEQRSIIKTSRNKKMTSLVDAIKTKSPLDVVQKIIDLGVSLEEKDEDSKTALMYAVINDDIDLATTLIVAGADIRAADSDGLTVFMHAVLNTSSCDLLESLLVKGADISVKNKSGYTALLLACESGDADLVPVLLSNGASLADKTQQKESALMLATRRGCPKIMTTLISAGADINSRDAGKETVLFKVQNEESFFLLLQAGANPAAVNQSQESVLMALVTRQPQLLGCVKHMLETGADPNSKDGNGNTPLMEACNSPSCEHLELVKCLIEKGANPSHQNHNGYCSLSHAISWGHVETIKLLLSAGANPSATHNRGFSLLMQLCLYKSEYLNIFNLLIEAGASVSNQENRKERSILMLAVNSKHINYVKRLIQCGANTSARDNFGNSVLHQVCDLEEENVELLNILIQSGVNTSAQNLKGKTALMLAVNRVYHHTVDILLKHGANVCAQDQDGRNVLMMVCDDYRGRNDKLVPLFIKNGVNLSAQDRFGRTALMLALHSRNFIVTEMLISAGINVSLEDREGITALMIACDKGGIKTVKMLLDAGACVSTRGYYGESAIRSAIDCQNADMLILLLKSNFNFVNKTRSVISCLSKVIKIKNHYMLEANFELTINKVLNHRSEYQSAELFYDLVEVFVKKCFLYGNDFCFQLYIAILELFAEEASNLNDSRIITPYHLKTHDLIMKAIIPNCRLDKYLKQVFDVIMKSPFKDVNWTSILPLQTKYSRRFLNILEDVKAPCQTIGFLISTYCEYSFYGSYFETLQASVQNLFDSGFSVNSNDPKVISPLTVLYILPCISHKEEQFFDLANVFFAKGVTKCQRLLRFVHQDHVLLSQQLQLPDALFLAFTYGHVTILPLLLPYWSAPPLALLLFVPPIHLVDDKFALQQVLDKVFPILVEIGGLLPPGHSFIKTIQTYLKKFAELHEEATELFEEFKQLHSAAPPSLKQLCRHVIRGCTQSSDDLPQRLSPLVPPGLEAYLTLSPQQD